MATDPVLKVHRLGFPWETSDPFLFCVHHDDAYPAGNQEMGPAASLAGRAIGQDFAGKDGWRMYHGDVVPGFPRHPHRGFETITVVRTGFVDHSDSLGATARYGQGDAQWMTAGKGVVHAEMFPLVRTGDDNPLELFQIWLNLPGVDKMVDPYFTMFWSERLGRGTFPDEAGRKTTVSVVAGKLEGVPAPPSPPPSSWAARPESDVAIWTIDMEPGATWTLPPARPGTNRKLYCFRGTGLHVGDRAIGLGMGALVRPDVPVSLKGGGDRTELLLLQGRPIGEPVVQYGPFVMQTRGEIQQAFADYHSTGFGGWPWDRDDPVHDRHKGRFAVHADGRVEEAG